jgi:CHAT domain-containing protein/tetratricopeptide (TPR) repeat protein
MLRSITPPLRIALSLSCLLFAVCSFVPHVAFAQTADDDASVRALVDRFFDLYQKRDLDGLMGLWSDKSPDFATSRQQFQQTFAANKIELRSLAFRKVEVSKEEANVRVMAEVFAEDVKTGKPAGGFGVINRTVHLVRAGEVWKLWQYLPSEEGLAAALLSAKTEEDRKAVLATDKELVTGELVRALLSEGRRLQTRGEYSAALNSYEIALSLSDQLRYPMGAANALRSVGVIQFSQADYGKALQCFEKSLKISQDRGYKLGIAYSLNNIASLYREQDRYAEALEYFQRSIKIAEELDDAQVIAGTLSNIGNVYDSQGKKASALEYYQRSLKISEELGYKRGIANAFNNIGNIHKSQSNFKQALGYYEKSLKLTQELGNKPTLEIILNNIGFVHDSQGNYAQALDYYQRSVKISEELGDKLGLAETLMNIGNVQDSLGKKAQALSYYQRGLSISRQIGSKRDIARALNNIGFVLASQGNREQALEYYQQSLGMKNELGDGRLIADTFDNIGAILASQGKNAEALDYYQKALGISEELGDRQMIARALTNIGSVYHSQNNNTLAREQLARAITTVEDLRRQVVGDEQQQQQFFQMMLSPYHQMIALSLDEKKPMDAFGYAERVKGRALLDALRNGRLQVTKAMTDAEKEEEQRLNADVVSLNTRINRENRRQQPDKAALSELEARLEKARVSYEGFQINLYAVHPELKIQRAQIEPVSLEQTAELIPDATTAVFEYVVTEDRTYLFVVTDRQQPRADVDFSTNVPNLNVYTIDVKQKDLAGRVERFRGRLTQKDAEFSDFARQFYDLLIGPTRSYLKDQTRLIIVPDGVLWEVPFQTLKSSANRFLIEDYAVSYAPSLTVLREMMNLKRTRRSTPRALTALVAFGNPDVAPTTEASLKTIYPEVLADAKLLPLPQTEDMLKTLGRLYGPDRSRIYIGAAAREDQAKKAGACRILQFATHGIIDNSNPMYSKLVMSQSGVDEHEDGMLEAWEIMNLDLKAEMVILSACETARGRVASGEGMIGLAWAFFVAGCPTTVVSQWPVEVNSMSELMVEFHKKLKPGIEGRGRSMSRAEALRAAALKLMRNPRYRHPFYWAPFVVIGDSR